MRRRRRSEEEEKKEEKKSHLPTSAKRLGCSNDGLNIEPWLNTSPEHIQQAQHRKRDTMCFPVQYNATG